MKIKVIMPTEVEVSYVNCYLFVRYWEDSDVSKDGSEFSEVYMDGSNLPQSMMLDYSPEITSYKGFENDKCFYMQINPDTGQIMNWEKGYAMKVHWKVVDQGVYEYVDNNGNVIKRFDCDYVPDYLAIEDSGFGDYVIMNIDSNGYIHNWNKEDFKEEISNAMTNNNEY